MKNELSKYYCIALCNAPIALPSNASSFQIWKCHRDALLNRMIYLFNIPISDLLALNISDIDFKNNSIQLHKPLDFGVIKINDGSGKSNRKIFKESTLFFDSTTRDILIKYLNGRKSGPLFLSSRKSRLSVREAERIIDYYASRIGLQSVIGKTKDGRKLKAVTTRSLQEAGARHTRERIGDINVILFNDDIDEKIKRIRMHHPLFLIKRL